MGSEQPTNLYSSEKEVQAYKELVHLLRNCPIGDNEILANIPLFLTRSTVAHTLFFNELYTKFLNIPGCIMEFGVRWGRNLALFESLRTLHEPFNYSRKIIGFDTFSGFPHTSELDGNEESVKIGNLTVSEDYISYLEKLLLAQEKLSPRDHLKKFILCQGDVVETLPRYLKENPETVVAFAYFDLDLYKPTKDCLNLLKKHLTKGSILGFDEFFLHEFPGETLAVKEVFGLDNIRMLSNPNVPHTAYFIVE